jgi:hypothetical protein
VICNWFGDRAVSLAAQYKHSAKFAKAGYTPVVVDGVEYGETREYGNFNFTRVYESGVEVPYYQPIAAQQLFNRRINMFDIVTGTISPLLTCIYCTSSLLSLTAQPIWVLQSASNYPGCLQISLCFFFPLLSFRTKLRHYPSSDSLQLSYYAPNLLWIQANKGLLVKITGGASSQSAGWNKHTALKLFRSMGLERPGDCFIQGKGRRSGRRH